MIRIFCLAMCFLAPPFWVAGQSIHFEEGVSIRNKQKGHYHKMVEWDEGQYQEFAYWEESALGSIVDHLNWRGIFPEGYNPGGTDRYPMIVMFHGAGESGRKYDNVFNYDPGDPRFDNNSHQLLFGGYEHMEAVGKPASDPQSFPGIVIFPQASYNAAWDDDDVRMVVGIIEYMIDNYHADPDRIAIHGLSNGAKGVWKIASQRPDLFSAVLTMSGVGTDLEPMTNVLATTPVWVFQGANDTNPSPDWASQWVTAIKKKGGEARYSVYNDQGHSIWNKAYAEPEFFPWILGQDKKNIRVMGGAPDASCGLTSATPVTLGYSAGFLEYQWLRDGVPVQGATSRYYTAAENGVYTVKFRRKTNGQWGESNPLSVYYSQPGFAESKPSLEATSSTHLPLSGGEEIDHTLDLVAPEGFHTYRWFKDGVLLESNSSHVRNLNNETGEKFQPGDAGLYSVQITDQNGCTTLASDAIAVTYAGSGSDFNTFTPYLYATNSTSLPLPSSVADKSLNLVANQGFAAYKWYKNGELLSEGAENVLTLNNTSGTLFQLADTGAYTVVLVNGEGAFSQASNTIKITYTAPDEAGADITSMKPYIYASSSIILPQPDSVADKTLSLIGPSGFAWYQWFKDELLVVEGTESSLLLNNSAGDHFQPSDAGVYKLRVQNEEGASSLFSNSVIITYNEQGNGEGDFSQFTPYLYASSSPDLPLPSATADKSLHLLASQGFSRYDWYKNDQLLQENGSSSLILNDEAGTMFVPADTGVYTVVVFNTDGISSLHSNSVRVTYSGGDTDPGDDITALVPHIYATSSPALPLPSDAADKSLQLVAPAGYSVYKWYHNNGVRLEGTENSLQLNDAAGQLFQLSDTGTYYVVVGDELGNFSQSSNSITVTYDDPQSTNDPPGGPEERTVSSGGIELSWTDTDYETGYEVWRARENTFSQNGKIFSGYPGSQYKFVASLPANTTTFADTGLRPGASYSYKIRALQANGGTFSESSASYITTLSDSQAPTAPANLEVTHVTEDQIHIQWEPATDDDVVLKYEIFLNGEKAGEVMGDKEGDPDPTDADPAPATNYALTGLKSRITYEIQVRAVDYQGNDFMGNASAFSNSAYSEVILGTEGAMEPEAVPALAYPNPFQQRVFITLPEKEGTQWPVALYDHSGRLVRSMSVAGGTDGLEIDLSGVQDGLYILSVGRYQFRIIKRN